MFSETSVTTNKRRVTSQKSEDLILSGGSLKSCMKLIFLWRAIVLYVTAVRSQPVITEARNTATQLPPSLPLITKNWNSFQPFNTFVCISLPRYIIAEPKGLQRTNGTFCSVHSVTMKVTSSEKCYLQQLKYDGRIVKRNAKQKTALCCRCSIQTEHQLHAFLFVTLHKSGGQWKSVVRIFFKSQSNFNSLLSGSFSAFVPLSFW